MDIGCRPAETSRCGGEFVVVIAENAVLVDGQRSQVTVGGEDRQGQLPITAVVGGEIGVEVPGVP